MFPRSVFGLLLVSCILVNVGGCTLDVIANGNQPSGRFSRAWYDLRMGGDFRGVPFFVFSVAALFGITALTLLELSHDLPWYKILYMVFVDEMTPELRMKLLGFHMGGIAVLWIMFFKLAAHP